MKELTMEDYKKMIGKKYDHDRYGLRLPPRFALDLPPPEYPKHPVKPIRADPIFPEFPPAVPVRKDKPDPIPFPTPEGAKKIDWEKLESENKTTMNFRNEDETTLDFRKNKKTVVRKWEEDD